MPRGGANVLPSTTRGDVRDLLRRKLHFLLPVLCDVAGNVGRVRNLVSVLVYLTVVSLAVEGQLMLTSDVTVSDGGKWLQFKVGCGIKYAINGVYRGVMKQMALYFEYKRGVGKGPKFTDKWGLANRQFVQRALEHVKSLVEARDDGDDDGEDSPLLVGWDEEVIGNFDGRMLTEYLIQDQCSTLMGPAALRLMKGFSYHAKAVLFSFLSGKWSSDADQKKGEGEVFAWVNDEDDRGDGAVFGNFTDDARDVCAEHMERHRGYIRQARIVLFYQVFLSHKNDDGDLKSIADRLSVSFTAVRACNIPDRTNAAGGDGKKRFEEEKVVFLQELLQVDVLQFPEFPRDLDPRTVVVCVILSLFLVCELAGR